MLPTVITSVFVATCSAPQGIGYQAGPTGRHRRRLRDTGGRAA